MERMVDCRLRGVLAVPAMQMLALWRGQGGWLGGDAWLVKTEVGSSC